MHDDSPQPAAPTVQLRAITDADLPILFEQQRDAEASRMAAFTPRDPDDRGAFMAHWSSILTDPTIIANAVLYGGEVAGNIVRFEYMGEPNVGYWIGRSFWGKGIATRALQAFVLQLGERPLFAGIASDNHGSRRVLEKCGFVVTGEARSFSHVRNAEVAELLLRLDADSG